MPENVTRHSASDVSIDWGGMAIGGVADGSFLKIEPNTDRVTRKVGAKGDTVYSKNADRSATVTVTLQNTSAALPQLREDADAGVERSLTVRNTGRDTGYLVSHPECVIQRVPGVDEAAESTNVDVIFLVPRLSFKK